MTAIAPPPRRRCRALAALLASACLATGCSDGRPAVHPVAGKVLFRGEPLPHGEIVFRPAGGAEGVPWPSGRIEKDGSFRLSTFTGGDGAPEGEYAVIVSTAQSTLGEAPLAREKPKPDPLGGRYLDPAKSGLKAQVKPGKNDLEPFRLD